LKRSEIHIIIQNRNYEGQGKMKQKTKWTQKRHGIVTALLRSVLGPYTAWKYNVKVEKFKEHGGRQYLIIMNHQTGFDQFFVAMTFPGAVYYIATEDIFSMGWISRVLSYLVAPIPIKKQTTDLQAVKNCAKVAREGGTIALAPEGNRTFDGRTAYIKPSIIKLIRILRLPVAIFRIEGGYGIQPRWSDVVRKGVMRTYVSRVVEPEEYKAMTDEELLTLVQTELYVDEACVSGEFHHGKRAEYMERAVYVCPDCGLAEFESHGDTIKCKKCGMEIEYTATKELKGRGFNFPFRFMADWYAYQNAFVNRLDHTQYLTSPMFCDTADVSEVILYKRKEKLWDNARVSLYGDRIVIGNTNGEDVVFSFDDVSVVTVLGKNKVNIYHGDKVYQLKGSKRFNALKYVNIFYHYKNIKEGKEDGEFLGL